MNNLKIEHIVLTSGEESVTLNNRLILAAEPGYGDKISHIQEIADNLEKTLGSIYDQVKMEPPHGHKLDWDTVLALRAAVQDLTIEDARLALVAHDISVYESDNGYCFSFDMPATGFPPLCTSDSNAGIAISTDFDTEEEAIMAAYQWCLSVQTYQEKALAYQAAQAEEGSGPSP